MGFWSGEKLEEELPTLITPFDKAAIDCAAYTLRVGDEIYVSPDRAVNDPSRHTKQKLKQGEGFTIPPGQFAFLVTKERIEVPDAAIAFISIRARLKFRGLVNISGFHVDPGYKGELVFSVLNVGPTPLHLEQGQELFLIWYADLDRQTEYKKGPGDGFRGIDTRLVNGISGEILSLQSLSDKQRALEADLLEKQRALDKGFTQQLQDQKRDISNLKQLVTIFMGAVLALIVGLIGFWIRTWMSAP